MIAAHGQKQGRQSTVVSRRKSRPLSARKSPQAEMAVPYQGAQREGLFVPRHGHSGFLRGEETRRHLFDELRLKVQMGHAVSGKQFSILFAEFETWYQNASPSKTKFNSTIGFLKAYALRHELSEYIFGLGVSAKAYQQEDRV